YWYMGRLGMTLRDVLTDQGARRWLARALNVRYFVLGTIRETNSFDVAAYLLDAEYGYQVSSAAIHIPTLYDLKFRLGELARLVLMSPEERLRYQRATQECQTILVEARRSSDKGDFSVAVEFYGKALKQCPFNFEISFEFHRARKRASDYEIEAL